MNILDDLIKNVTSKIKGQDLVDDYIHFLEKEYPALVKSYRNRLKHQPTSANAEAVTFHFLRTYIDEVKINEHPTEGGTDFLCKTGDSKFIAEITSIATDTVTKKSGLKDDPTTENPVFQNVSPITQKLCDTVNSKQRQMSEYNYPGILVIASDHCLADILFDPFDAQRLLVGDMMIGLRDSKLIDQTKLKYSCFLQVNPDFDVCNRSISAVLLFHMAGANAFLLGVIHPDPKHSFSPEFLPSVPFIRLKKYPPEGNVLEVEWVKYEQNELVITEPEQKTFWYDPRFN